MFVINRLVDGQTNRLLTPVLIGSEDFAILSMANKTPTPIVPLFVYKTFRYWLSKVLDLLSDEEKAMTDRIYYRFWDPNNLKRNVNHPPQSVPNHRYVREFLAYAERRMPGRFLVSRVRTDLIPSAINQIPSSGTISPGTALSRSEADVGQDRQTILNNVSELVQAINQKYENSMQKSEANFYQGTVPTTIAAHVRLNATGATTTTTTTTTTTHESGAPTKSNIVWVNPLLAKASTSTTTSTSGKGKGKGRGKASTSGATTTSKASPSHSSYKLLEEKLKIILPGEGTKAKVDKGKRKAPPKPKTTEITQASDHSDDDEDEDDGFGTLRPYLLAGVRNDPGAGTSSGHSGLAANVQQEGQEYQDEIIEPEETPEQRRRAAEDLMLFASTDRPPNYIEVDEEEGADILYPDMSIGVQEQVVGEVANAGNAGEEEILGANALMFLAQNVPQRPHVPEWRAARTVPRAPRGIRWAMPFSDDSDDDD